MKNRFFVLLFAAAAPALVLGLLLSPPAVIRAQGEYIFQLVEPTSMDTIVNEGTGANCTALDNNTISCSYTTVPAGGASGDGRGAHFNLYLPEPEPTEPEPGDYVGMMMVIESWTHPDVQQGGTAYFCAHGYQFTFGSCGVGNRIYPSVNPNVCAHLSGTDDDPAWEDIPCTALWNEWRPGFYPVADIRLHSSSGATLTGGGTFVVSWYYVKMVEPAPPPPPPPPGDEGFGGFATCTFTTTITMTDTDGVTNTQTVTYTRPGNLVENYSFETPNPNGPGPAGWTPSKNGTVTNNVPDYYDENGIANGGVDSVFDSAVFDLYNSVITRKNGDYAIGFFANGADAELYWNGVLKAASTGVTTTFQIYTNTFSVGGGASWLHIAFKAGTGETNVDDAFVFPVDESGNLLCDPDFYEPYDPDDDTISIGGIPGPIGGAGATCYRCSPPNNLSATSVSYWIAWLGCVLRNMFSCSLRVWLLVIGNWLRGQIQIALAWLAWTPQTVQNGVIWFASSVAPLLGGVRIIYQNSTNLWDLLIVVIGLIASVMLSLSNLVITVIQMIIGFITAIRAAFTADPYVFNFNVSGFGPGPGEAALAMAGPNDDKILYLFLVALGVMDQSFVGTHAEILLIVMGIVGIGIAIWTLNFWKDLVSF